MPKKSIWRPSRTSRLRRGTVALTPIVGVRVSYGARSTQQSPSSSTSGAYVVVWCLRFNQWNY
eukprot:2976251-Pyramimonas_sp.AAC.1